jgi:hypothetical protein
MGLFDIGSGIKSFADTTRSAISAAASVAGAVNGIAGFANGIRNATNIGQAATNIIGAANVATNLSRALTSATNPAQLASALRSLNLPPGGERAPTASASAFIGTNDASAYDWRVKLDIPAWFLNNGVLSPLQQSDSALIFPYTPTVSLTGSAMYDEQAVTHQNYQFVYFQNGKSEQIQIAAPFNVEDMEQGAYWIAAVHFLRSATKMFSGNDFFAGNPPIICKLNGYGNFVFKNIPVVIRSFTFDLPQDVNYINVGGQSWVPVKSTLNITLQPIYSRTQVRQFSLSEFVNGNYVDKGYL